MSLEVMCASTVEVNKQAIYLLGRASNVCLNIQNAIGWMRLWENVFSAGGEYDEIIKKKMFMEFWSNV